MSNKRLFKTGLIYFLAMTVFIGIRIFYSVPNVINIPSYSSTIFIQVGAMFVIPIIFYNIFFNKSEKLSAKKLFKLKVVSIKSLPILILIPILLFFLGLFISAITSSILSILGFEVDTINMSSGNSTNWLFFLQGVILISILPGIFEEIFHRGFLLTNLSLELGYKRAIIISSILFALIHLNISQSFHAAIIGLVLSVLVVITSSIWAAIIPHIIFNLIIFYIYFANGSDLFLGNFLNNTSAYISSLSPFLVFIYSFLGLTLISVIFTFAITKLYKQNNFKNVVEVKEKIDLILKDEGIESYENITSEQEAVIKDVLKESGVYPFSHIDEIKKPIDLIFPVTKNDKYKPKTMDMLSIYASIFLGLVITIMTFIWGII